MLRVGGTELLSNPTLVLPEPILLSGSILAWLLPDSHKIATLLLINETLASSINLMRDMNDLGKEYVKCISRSFKYDPSAISNSLFE